MAAAELQSLLRFLSQDAKIPLAVAMSKVKELQKAGLNNPDDIGRSELQPLQTIFKDEKTAKKVLNAAKRNSKKRAAPSSSDTVSTKKAKKDDPDATVTPFQIESNLAVPVSPATEEELSNTVVLTNRAPLVLAFAVTVLKYTMPEQPISSRLSLAQAVVSANSRSKAVSLGLESGNSAEEEGWGKGLPVVKVLGREIRVLKRWDYNPMDGKPDDRINSESSMQPSRSDAEETSREDAGGMPPLWGVDLEAMRKSNAQGKRGDSQIHTADAARTYLMKAFALHKESNAGQNESPRKKSNAALAKEKEEAVGLVLRAIDLLCESWASTLSTAELDRRAWAWYLRVRPEVQSGTAGWGEKGQVRLSDILRLRREEPNI
ncbi:hypothetical protein Plec18167_006231 [Paecilomyces lecythidis]|uniref:Uncharacterized protein n=1 Tax=Paecilomyces lecythidis TaxID=3004212 RepID=A0ABR3XCP8_9EURO